MHGLHLTADLRGCAADTPLADPHALQQLCLHLVADCGLTAVAQLFHPFHDARGRPAGVTAVVLLAESHLAIHTWPEMSGVNADVFVCNLGADNSTRAQQLMAALVQAFRPAQQRVQSVQRGAVREVQS